MPLLLVSASCLLGPWHASAGRCRLITGRQAPDRLYAVFVSVSILLDCCRGCNGRKSKHCCWVSEVLWLFACSFMITFIHSLVVDSVDWLFGVHCRDFILYQSVVVQCNGDINSNDCSFISLLWIRLYSVKLSSRIGGWVLLLLLAMFLPLSS